jgi:uncharacterized membrane protein required for colicin V production
MIGLGIVGAVAGAFWNRFSGGAFGCVAGLFIGVIIVLFGTSMEPPKE